MEDDIKRGSLFSNEINELNDIQKSQIKKNFTLAQTNGSPMWQDVVSFDNSWLEEVGLYNSKTKQLDEDKVKNVIRESVSTLLKSENMLDSAIWTASIHYNTDNIHVHIAIVEPFPTREKKRFFDIEKQEWIEQYRAKRKQGSIDKMKSKVANLILDRSQDYNKIDELIRGTVHQKKSQEISILSNKRMEKLFYQSISLLPSDIRQWKYGYQSTNQAKPYIDEIVDIYLETYHKEEMEKLNELLDEQVSISERLFGTNSNHEKYKETKLSDLRRRMGNAVLTEMREYVKQSRSSVGKQKDTDFKTLNRFQVWNPNHRVSLHYYMIRLTNSLRKTYHEYKKDRNFEEYDRMMEK